MKTRDGIRLLRWSLVVIGIVVGALSPTIAAAQYRYPNIYDAAREGARQGAIDAERERQNYEQAREAEQRAAEQKAREDAIRDATSREYWRRENERLAPGYQRLLTP